jgi:hypothetical protein
MEIGIIIGLAVLLIGLSIYNWYKRNRKHEWIYDPEIRISRNPVYVGQHTDINFLFSIRDLRRRRGRGEVLSYAAEIYVDGNRVAQRTSVITQTNLRTSLPYLGASWQTPGAKQIKAVVKLTLETQSLFSHNPNNRTQWPADDMTIEDVVNVVVEEESEHDH